jgi:hypothetical protein
VPVVVTVTVPGVPVVVTVTVPGVPGVPVVVGVIVPGVPGVPVVVAVTVPGVVVPLVGGGGGVTSGAETASARGTPSAVMLGLA